MVNQYERAFRAGPAHTETAAAAAATCPPLEPSAAAGDRPVPLSHAQQSLWFLDQATPGLRTHNVPVVLRLRGDLDMAALRGALADVVARHEPLRTAFADAPGGPVQQVHDALDIGLPVTQTAGEPAEREAAAWELIRADADRAFAVATDQRQRCRHP